MKSLPSNEVRGPGLPPYTNLGQPARATDWTTYANSTIAGTSVTLLSSQAREQTDVYYVLLRQRDTTDENYYLSLNDGCSHSSSSTTNPRNTGTPITQVAILQLAG